MSQRRMVPKRLPEGGGLDAVGLSSQEEDDGCFSPQCRQWLACICAMLTMVMAGTVYGWTTTSLIHLTSGTDDMPLTLTYDESSWIVSLTVLGSIIGSLMAVMLTDCCGRKFCLLMCCSVFTFGWMMVFYGTDVPVLYFARMFLGIGVGIAYTVNPMYVSEVADINFRCTLCILITVNVFVGSLITCILGLWLRYKALVAILIILSCVSFCVIKCFPDTPHFLIYAGRFKKACKSIEYYKGIVESRKMKTTLRALRPQTSCKLQSQDKSDLTSQSRSDLTSQSRSNLSSQSDSNLYVSSRSNFSLPSTSYFNVSSGSYYSAPSETQSHLDSISELYSKAICEVHPQPSGELRPQSVRHSLELPFQSPRELRLQPPCEVHRPSTRGIDRSSTCKIHRPSTRGIDQSSTCEIHRPSTREIERSSTCEIHRPSTREIERSSTCEIHRPSTREIDRSPTCEIHRPSTREIDRSPTCEIHRPSTRGINRPSTSEIRSQPTREIRPQPTSETHPEPTREIHSRSRSDLCIESNVDSHGSIAADEINIELINYTWSSKFRVIQRRNNRKALFLMLGLIMAQQLSGNFITTQYLEVLFSATMPDMETKLATILILAVGFISGILSICIVKFLRRRTLLILSTLGSCFTLFILATHCLLVQFKFDVPIDSALPLIDLIIYQVMFQIGLGTLPNVLLCELFPTELTGFAGAIISSFDGIIGFTVSILYQVIAYDVGLSVIYFIFTIACCLAFLMVFQWVPETKGKTYHEINALLIGKHLTSLNKEVKFSEKDIRRI